MSGEIDPEEYAAAHGIRATVKLAVEAQDDPTDENLRSSAAFYRAALRSSLQRRGSHDGMTIDIQRDLSRVLFKLHHTEPEELIEANRLANDAMEAAEKAIRLPFGEQGGTSSKYRFWAIIQHELDRMYERARVAHQGDNVSNAITGFQELIARLSRLPDLVSYCATIQSDLDPAKMSDWISNMQNDSERALKICTHKVQVQAEYYFSSKYLQSDIYLRKQMDGRGFVLLMRIGSFRRLFALTQSYEALRNACKRSKVLELMTDVHGIDYVRVQDRPEQWVFTPDLRIAQIDRDQILHFQRAVAKGDRTCRDFPIYEKQILRLRNFNTVSPPKLEVDAVTEDLKLMSTNEVKSKGRVPSPSPGLAPPSHTPTVTRRSSTGAMSTGKGGTPAPGPPAKLFDTQEGGDGQATRIWFRDYLDRETQPLLQDQRREASYHRAGCSWVEPACKCETLKTRRRVRIAILDTGIDGTNETIKTEKRIKAKWSPIPDLLPGDEDTSGHGTHLAKLLLRIAPAANIYVARVFSDKIDLSEEHIAAAIEQAVRVWEVDIINMSFGFRQRKPKIASAIKEAHERNILMFAAASNDGLNPKISVAYPARDDRCFCIYATDYRGNFSAFNPNFADTTLAFSTLGEAVLSTHLGGRYKLLTGTSVAAPIAAATAALILEFARQKPLAGQVATIERKELLETETIAAIRMIFEDMSRGKSEHRYIPPWYLLTTDPDNDPENRPTLPKARDDVTGEISRSLKKF